jgi:spore maturation protein CgeB
VRILMFYHSLLSDWNHGNAHFLRGIVAELLSRGHQVEVFEPKEGWSLKNLLAEHGQKPLRKFRAAYPGLNSTPYDPAQFDPARLIEDADLVLVHEWNDPRLVAQLGQLRASTKRFRLLFHDTHHRMATAYGEMAAYDLSHYDGVLAYGNVIRELYLCRGRTRRAWTWHEAADTRIFHYIPYLDCEGDVVWIGNWGDGERTAELEEFLLRPVKELGLKARVHGVRYPDEARRALAEAGIDYRGWLPNYEAPEVFARFRATIHVPRRPYVEGLRGIPTIRMFEALACGIPLVSAPWDDTENLFHHGRDFLVAADGHEMKQHLAALIEDRGMARELALHGRQTILARHTCAHRADELLEIASELGVATETVVNLHA